MSQRQLLTAMGGPSSGMGGRMPTAAGRGSVGGRMATGRMGTANRMINTSGIGLATEVNIAARPMTKGGVGGMRTSAGRSGAASKRRIQDISYWRAELRSRNGAIAKETARMNREVEQVQRDATKYAQYERRYEDLNSEVRTLEGQLADYNLAKDKISSGISPSDIEDVCRSIRERNQMDAKEVDSIFVHVQAREAETAELTQRIEQMEGQTEERIGRLDPTKLSQWNTMRGEAAQLAHEVSQYHADLEMVNGEVIRAETEMQTGDAFRWRRQFERVAKHTHHLEKEEAELASELENLSLTPEEARDRLLTKVKADGAKNQQVQSMLQTLEQRNEELGNELGDIEQDIEDRKKNTHDADKWELLVKKDRDMSRFIESYPAKKEELMRAAAASEQMVVRFLEHISDDLSRQRDLPSAQRFKKMKEELDFKKRQATMSQSTLERLRAEVTKRQKDMQKIATLEPQIEKELKTLATKMDMMRTASRTLTDIDGLRSRAKTTMRDLEDLTSQCVQFWTFTYQTATATATATTTAKPHSRPGHLSP